MDHDDNLDPVQRHALHRLKGYDELIQGHEAAQLMGEHGIHLHDDDPYEAGEVDDDHMVPKAHAVPHHHSPDVPLHTSQDTLYRSGLEHYIRHPYTGGGGIGPQPGEPHTWEHNGEHWIGGGHHRILADRMTYRNGTKVQDVTNRRRLGFRQATADARFRCPCGIPVEYDPSDGWQHADGSISHDGEFYPHSVSDLMEEHGGHTAGKGKPRRDAPDVARGAGQAGQRSSGGVAPDSGRDGDGGKPPAPLRALAEHPKVSRDLAKLPRNVQAAYHERVDGLRRGEPHSSTHALTGPLKGWQGTNLNFLNRVVHRYDGGELHVLSAGNHDEAYDQGARRLGRYTAPHERLFGPTFGLDTRLWDEDANLRDSVRMDVITRFDAFCHEHGYEGWHRWTKIVFFGSEASEWTSKALVGNGDFDLSIGIHYPALRATVPGFAGLADEIIAAGLTQEMHQELNDPQHRFPGVPGVFDMTWYANLQGWDIARIRPYAAYDVVADEWIVRPPHLPDWSMTDFPEGEGLTDEVHGIVLMAEGILKMPEPYRTQNGAALWEFVHSNRSDAFGETGEGWWDARNVVEKALDQKGLMQKLWECHDRAQQAPESLASPSDWSNSPVAAR